jgi:hypothetical protein
MTNSKVVLACATMLSLAALSVHGGQTDSAAATGRSVFIMETVDAGVWTILDGRTMGRGPLTVDSLPAGVHIVRSIPGSIASWGFPGSIDTVIIGAGDTLRLTYPRKGTFLISSIPSGAKLMEGDSLIGLTPLTLPDTRRGDCSAMVLEKDGYARTRLSSPDDNSPFLRVFLQPGEMPQSASVRISTSKFASPGVILTGSVAFLAGAAAAWLKIEADGKSESYALKADPALRDQIERLDRWGGLSILLCEGMIAYLTYLLLAD